MGGYECAVTVTFVICFTFLVAYLASFVAQHIWAWIDDSKPLKGNVLSRFISSKVKLTRWTYPVYLREGEEIWGYAKDKKYENAKVHDYRRGNDLEYGKDYKYTEFFLGFYWILCFLLSSVPWVVLLFLEIPYVFISVFTLVLIAFISRFMRRLNKKSKVHIGNSEVHKK